MDYRLLRWTSLISGGGLLIALAALMICLELR